MDERAQAFTLEGITSVAILLTALLFALQSVVVTPTTGGTVDQADRRELRQRANDALVSAARLETQDLSWLVRYWSSSQRRFKGALNADQGYGPNPPPGKIGDILQRSFGSRNRLYNLEMRYQTTSGFEIRSIVSRGAPSENAVVASHMVVLYDDQYLSTPNASPNLNLSQYDTVPNSDPVTGKTGHYPIPDVVEGPVYNVVEVRLIVW